jgi:uncharacterized protein YqeY
MTLTEKIGEDLKNAMREGEKLRLETLRMVRAALLELAKSGTEVTPELELETVMRQGKRRRDAAEQYRAANREDLAVKEESELLIIEEYLPKKLDEDAIRAAIQAIISETGAAGPGDFKVVMPKAMSQLKGQADGGRVQALVKELLTGAGT